MGKAGGKIGGKASVETHGKHMANGANRRAERWAKRTGMQGGAQCPGCDNRGVREECDVCKDGVGCKGSDDVKGFFDCD
jgi:hypothetical protein